MRKRISEYLDTMSMWVVILFSVLKSIIILSVLITPGIAIMPLIGRIDEAERIKAKSEWEATKEVININSFLVDTYMNYNINIGERFWFRSVFGVVSSTTGLVDIAINLSEAVMSHRKEGGEEIIIEKSKSTGFISHFINFYMQNATRGEGLDTKPVYIALETLQLLTILYLVTGFVLSRVAGHILPDPLITRGLIYLRNRRIRWLF